MTNESRVKRFFRNLVQDKFSYVDAVQMIVTFYLLSQGMFWKALISFLIGFVVSVILNVAMLNEASDD